MGLFNKKEQSDDDKADAFYTGLTLVGRPLWGKQRRTLVEHSRSDERPWLIINAGAGNGVLAAFDDRLIIMKVGAMTALSASAMGGGRVTTFPFSEITNVEINTGMITGVIEVLTAAYNGSQSNDFWRGANKLNAGNTAERSNTLPTDKMLLKEARPHLVELERRIAEYKRGPVSGNHNVSARGLAAELAKLAELRNQGVLSEAEFTAAKQSLLS